MMNRRERQIVAQIYHCLSRMEMLKPYNPADIAKAISAVDLFATCCKHLRFVVSNLNVRQLDFAEEELETIHALLDKRFPHRMPHVINKGECRDARTLRKAR